MTTRGGAIPSCILGDLSKDTNPSGALGNALALEDPEAGGRHMTEGWEQMEPLPSGWLLQPQHAKRPFP